MLSSTSRRRFPALGAALIAVVATLALLSPSAPATAAEGDTAATVGVATRPAGEDGRPDGRSRFTYTADPGQSVTDRVLVGNTGTARQDFTVYATDAYNGDDGGFALLATAETPTAVGAWLRFDDGSDRATFSLEPNEVRLLTFTIAFPADATPGDHVGGLVASVVEPGQQVTVDRRVATTISARVSGELQPQLSISSYDASYEGDWWNPFAGDVRLRYTVTNPGNVALAANLTSGVSTWFGLPATGMQGGSIPVLLPGSTATYEFTLSGAGQWLFLNPRTVLSPFVDSPDASQQVSVTPVSRDAIAFAVPWTLLILLAVAAGVFFLLRWRRRRDEARAQEWMDYMERATAAEAKELAAAAGAGTP